MNSKPLFQIISEAMTDDGLPKDFSLPPLSDDANALRWQDGAMDGVALYHMGVPRLQEENRERMIQAVKAAAAQDFEKADALFEVLGKEMHALSMIDELQQYIIAHKEEVPAGRIFQYGVHALLDSSDREVVKFGLSFLEMLVTDDQEELKQAIRIVGLCEEFTLFALFVMARWNEKNEEIFELAKTVHGWGRIHAVDRLEPETEEIRRWFLLDGVHNNVMPSYSALVCWKKSDAETVLKNGPSDEEFSGIRDIIEGLLDEGPVRGISGLENAEEMILRFLEEAGKRTLALRDYEVIYEILGHFEEGPIPGEAKKLLETDTCRNLVMDAVRQGRDISLASYLELDYKPVLMERMWTSFEENYWHCKELMKDNACKDEVMDLFRSHLALETIKAEPTKTLGLGPSYQNEQALECLVQELASYPMEGLEFIETALQAEPVRTRNIALNVLESWVGSSEKPLSEILPEFQDLLQRLREIEPDENVRNRMEQLTSGCVSFDRTIKR